MDQNTSDSVLAQIKTPLRLTHAGLWAERLTRSFWPFWTVAMLSLAALAFGLQDQLPLEAAWLAMVAGVLGLIWGLGHGYRSFRRPTRTDALVRLDQRLPGQPIAALNDTQAIGATDAASIAVWTAHRNRMAALAAQAKTVEPNLRLASRDPYALRYVALTAIVMAVLFGSIWRVGSITSLTPGGTIAAATGPAWEGWAQPPAYTGKPALYLGDQTAEALTLPVGTRMQIRLYGEPGALILSETVSGRTTVPPASQSSHDFTIAQSGNLAINGTGGREWQIIAIPDVPPSVTTMGAIGREADGRFKQKFVAKDDYAVAKGQVTITLDLQATDRHFGLAANPEPQEPVILDLPLPVKGSRADISATLVDDLSQHVFSNLPVSMTFSVTDAAGQTGSAAPLHLVLPGRRFFDPVAAALIEMRRDLLWSRDNAVHSVEILKAVTHRPEGFFPNERAYLRLRVALKRLDADATQLDPKVRDEIAEELWQIALLVEEGDLSSALARLRRAQDRLDEAIRNGASPEETQDLMTEMKQALNEYLKELGKQNKGEKSSENQPGVQMSQDQLQQMLDKLQQLMDEGKTAEAAQLMEQLRQFMENMQVTQGEGGQGQGTPGQQAMKDLGQTLRDQQGLSDDAFKDLQQGQPGSDGQQQPGEGDGKSLSERQQELRQKLSDLGKGGKLPGKDSEKGSSGQQQLDDAGRAMEDAERALREGDLPGALDKQADAMDKMRKGMADFGEALAEQNRRDGNASQGEQTGQDDPNGTRDPLGREKDNSARIGSDKNLLQGDDVYRRAQDLLEEIRRRTGEQTRPETERNYLKRLLDLF